MSESEIWKLQNEVQNLQDRLASAGQELHTYFLSCMELEKVNDGLVETVVDLRKALEEISKDFHSCDCPEAFGPGPGCQCHVGLAKEALQ